MAPPPREISQPEEQDAKLSQALRIVAGRIYDLAIANGYKGKKDNEDHAAPFNTEQATKWQEELRASLEKMVRADYDSETGRISVYVEWPSRVSNSFVDGPPANSAVMRAVTSYSFSTRLERDDLQVGEHPTQEEVDKALERAKNIASKSLAEKTIDEAQRTGRRQYASEHDITLRKMTEAVKEQALFKLLDAQAKEAARERNAALRKIHWNSSKWMKPEEMEAEANDKYLKKAAADPQRPEMKDNPANFTRAAMEQRKLHQTYDRLEELLIEGGKAAGLSEKEIVLAVFHARSKDIYDIDYSDAMHGEWKSGRSSGYKPVFFDPKRAPAPRPKAPGESPISVLPPPATPTVRTARSPAALEF